jgi:hypothetical protein
MAKQNTKKTADTISKNCEKYEIAITNFVTGAKMDISEAELFTHLAQCKNCQGDLRNWQATHATLCAKEYDSRPEVKAKNEAFIKNLVHSERSESVYGQQDKPTPSHTDITPGRVLIDIKNEVKQDVKTVYSILKTHGELAVPVIVEKANIQEYRVRNAICCMGLNDMIMLSKDNKTAYAKLQPGAQL